MSEQTRRDVLRLATATTAAGVLTLGSAATAQSNEGGWKRAESPTGKVLNDAVDTTAGPFAAGDEGTIYERQSAGQWRRYETGVESKLDGIAAGSAYDVAVGDGGTLLERRAGDSETGAGGGTDTDTSGGNSTDTGNETNSTAITTASRSMDGPTAEPLSVENYVEGEWVTPPER